MASTASLRHGLCPFKEKIITQGKNIVLQILSKIYPPPGEMLGRGEGEEIRGLVYGAYLDRGKSP